MIKKLFSKGLKTIVIIGLFFSFILNTFALDAELQINKQQVNINDVFNLRLQVKSSEGGELKIKSIKGIENFKILGQSQSQSSSTSVVIINGKTKTQAITTINLDLTLSPLKNGEFEIGPAILQNGTGTIKTNKITIKVSGEKNILLNKGNTNNFQKQVLQNNIKQNLGNNLNNINSQKQKNIGENYEKNNYELYLLLVILLISGIGFYFLYQNKDKLNINNDIKKEDLKNKEKQEKEEIDFEEKTQVEIIYPKTEEENFEEKIDKTFRQKLQNSYNIKNIDSLTFEEIKKFVDKDKLQDFEEIISNLNKIKYSNIIGDKTKIIELVKKF